VVGVAFVHGHPRDLGWVKAHRRRPNRAEDGQLPLIAESNGDDHEATAPATWSDDPAEGDRVVTEVTGSVE
jgi:hypothetical protein